MALKDDLENLEENIADLNKLGASTENTFKSIGDAISGLARDSKDFKNDLKTASKSSSDLAKSASTLARFTKEDLKDKKSVADFSRKAQELARQRQKTEAQIRNLQILRVNATKAEKAILDKTIENLQNGVGYSQGIADGFNEILDTNQKLKDNTQFFDSLSETLSTIPGIGPAIAKPFANAAKAMRDARIDGDGFFGATIKGADELAKSFGPAALLGSLFAADSSTTNLAKNLGVSKGEAREIKQDFELIAVNSGKAYLTGVKFAAAMGELGAEIGAVAGFTADQLQSQIELTKLAGLQSSEAAGLVEFGILQNKEQSQVTSEILDQVVALEKESGIRLDGRKVLAEVAKVNGQLGAQYGYNTAEIAKAVVQANKLGLSLKQTQGIANNLLNFEQSISNELEAELLIGRDLNLEKARLLALNGDSAGAAAEMAKQFGSAEEFTKLNVLQQQSLAQAMGMNADELADSLRKQEVLNSLGVTNIEQLAEQGRLEELKGTESGKTLYQQYLQQSAADKFADAMSKIQSAIGTIVEGPLGGLIDGMASFASSAGAVYTTLGLIGAISLGKTIASLATMAIQLGIISAEAITANAMMSFGAGIAIAGIAIAAGLSYLNSAKDEAVTPVDDMIMPSGYGDRILSTPKGQIALNNQDTIVAGTNLGGGDGNSESRRTNQLLEMILSKQGVVKMDSVDVGTAFSMNTYQVQ